MAENSPERVENVVGKGEIARYEQFLHFPQRFQKNCSADTQNIRFEVLVVLSELWVERKLYQSGEAGWILLTDMVEAFRIRPG